MSKISIEVSRGTTVNISSFNSIKPVITVKIDDVDVNKAADVYSLLSDIVSNLWAMEVISVADEFNTMEEMGINNYINELKDRKELIKDQTDDLWKKIQQAER